MRSVVLIAILALALLAALIFGMGLDDRFARMAVGLQRDYQNALARTLRALRGGETNAVIAFLGVCFAYGFFHALGPGHGKAVIGAYGMATDVPLSRMVGLAALSSLAQATMAVAVVYLGVWALGGAREQVEGLSGSMEPFSAAAIALLGLFLCWRGLRRFLASRYAREHVHSDACGCGHAHVPDMEQVLATRSRREVIALVAGVALRPCTGALFLLILTWRLGLEAIGIAGTYVMGLGTMMVTGLAAAVAVALRNGVFFSIPKLRGMPALASAIEISIGSLVAILAGSAAVRMI